MAWPHPITVIGLLSGGVAALLMAQVLQAFEPNSPLPTDVLVSQWVGGAPADHWVAGRVVHVVVGALLGGVYPFLFRGLLRIPGRYIAELPWTIPTAIGLATGVFLLTYVLIKLRLLKIKLRDVWAWVRLYAYFLVWGVALAVGTGLARPLWYQMF